MCPGNRHLVRMFIFIILMLLLFVSCGKKNPDASAVTGTKPLPAQSSVETAADARETAAETTVETDGGSGIGETVTETAALPDAEGETFDVSNPKWNWIEWDADGDGEKEELEFEFEDQGDEAPSCIIVKLYDGSDCQEAYIDRAYGLYRVLASEDGEGPFLQIDFEMGDYYSHDAQGCCIVRLRGGILIVEPVE